VALVGLRGQFHGIVYGGDEACKVPWRCSVG